MRPTINFRSSHGNAEVVPQSFRIEPDPFKQLTANLVIAQYRAGILPEAVIVALLAGTGLRT